MNLNLKSNHELLKIARDVSISKDLLYEDIIEIISEAIRDSLQSFYGKNNINVKLNSTSGEIKITKEFTVTENIKTIEDDDYKAYISLEDAKKHKEDVQCGELINIPMTTDGSFNQDVVVRVRSSIAKRLGEAERIQLYKKYSKRIGEIIHGTVKRIGHGVITVLTNGVELRMPIGELIPGEIFKQDDLICAAIELSENSKYGEIFLSRASENFVAGLFAREIPEIYDGVIKINAIARIVGFKTKIAVSSSDPNVEPVGACIGRGGSRIKQINKELQREKIDVIEYSSDIGILAKRSMLPAKVKTIDYDEESNSAKIVVNDEDLSVAIGKNGSNTKLASKLLRCKVTVVGEDAESKNKMELFSNSSLTLAKELDVEDIIAQILFAEGFCSIELVANAGIEKLSQIQGFDEGISQEIINRANKYLKNIDEKYLSKIRDQWLREKAFKFAKPILSAIIDKGILTIDSFADLSLDEIEEIMEEKNVDEKEIDLEKIGELIVEAREILNFKNN